MKDKTLAITLSVALLTGLASLDAVAGKGGGASGGGMPATGMGGMSKGIGSGGSMKGSSGMGGMQGSSGMGGKQGSGGMSGMGGKQGSGGMSGMGGAGTMEQGIQPRERYRYGEKDVGVRTRNADQAR